jgi:hypothetical protein
MPTNIMKLLLPSKWNKSGPVHFLINIAFDTPLPHHTDSPRILKKIIPEFPVILFRSGIKDALPTLSINVLCKRRTRNSAARWMTFKDYSSLK